MTVLRPSRHSGPPDGLSQDGDPAMRTIDPIFDALLRAAGPLQTLLCHLRLGGTPAEVLLLTSAAADEKLPVDFFACGSAGFGWTRLIDSHRPDTVLPDFDDGAQGAYFDAARAAFASLREELPGDQFRKWFARAAICRGSVRAFLYPGPKSFHQVARMQRLGSGPLHLEFASTPPRVDLISLARGLAEGETRPVAAPGRTLAAMSGHERMALLERISHLSDGEQTLLRQRADGMTPSAALPAIVVRREGGLVALIAINLSTGDESEILALAVVPDTP